MAADTPDFSCQPITGTQLSNLYAPDVFRYHGVSSIAQFPHSQPHNEQASYEL